MWDVEVDLVDGSVAHILELSVGGVEEGQSFEWPGTLQGEAGEGGLPLDPENLLLMEPSPFAEIVDRLVAIAQEECPGMEILSGVHQLAA